MTINPKVQRLFDEDLFRIDQAGILLVDLSKAEDLDAKRPIGGFCSTEKLDRQDEIVIAKGLDFSEFVQFGYFNDNHKQDTAAILGYPEKAKLQGRRWWTEGRLFKGYPPSDKIWELAKVLKQTRSPRRLGFSIEGKVTERDHKNRILKAKVRHVAITNSPVNTECTWDILSKAFASDQAVTNNLRKSFAQVQELAVHPIILERSNTKDFSSVYERIRHLCPTQSAERCRTLALQVIGRI